MVVPCKRMLAHCKRMSARRKKDVAFLQKDAAHAFARGSIARGLQNMQWHMLLSATRLPGGRFGPALRMHSEAPGAVRGWGGGGGEWGDGALRKYNRCMYVCIYEVHSENNPFTC